MMYQTILFDLDGTLTDPKVGITKCVQYALLKMGIEENDLDKLEPFIGPPLVNSFMEYYGLDCDGAKQAVEYYRERFATVGMYENVVYDGIIDLLAELNSQGKKLIVATSKPTVFSVKILKHFGLYDYFSAVIGSNLDGTRVDKGEVIECAIKELAEHEQGKIVMVGDRKYDILGAKRNNIDVIAVSYGYGGCEELAEAKPNYVVATVNELKKIIC